jgi:hypothetical protein
MILEFS